MDLSLSAEDLAFADELSAFSLGTVDSPDSAADTATEEEAKA